MSRRDRYKLLRRFEDRPATHAHGANAGGSGERRFARTRARQERGDLRLDQLAHGRGRARRAAIGRDESRRESAAVSV